MKYLILVTFVSPIITAYIKKLLPQIPKRWIPLIAPALGGLAEGVMRLSVGTDLPEGVGVAAGAAGVAVREVVDQWRKSGEDGASVFAALLAVTLGLGSLGMTGCSATAGGPSGPPSAETLERRCQWAETLAMGAKLGAAFAVNETKDEDVRKGVMVALGAVDAGLADYCDAVRSGAAPDAERAALAALREAIDRLTKVLLDDLKEAPAPS